VGCELDRNMLKNRQAWTFRVLALAMAFTFIGRANSQQAPQKDRSKPSFKCAANLKDGEKSQNNSAGKADADKQYVGAGTCRGCHSEIPESFDQGPHGKIMTDTCALPKWQNCETCHGPGRQHADTGGDQDTIIFPPALSPKDLNQRCLSCHELPKGHNEFIDLQASPQKTGCLDCHSVHNKSKVKKAP
jgi:hypothetical protein